MFTYLTAKGRWPAALNVTVISTMQKLTLANASFMLSRWGKRGRHLPSAQSVTLWV